MSSYDEASRKLETEQQKQGGEGAFLSQDERQQVRRILKFPEEFPREFGSWMTEYMAVNGLSIPISNIVGFQRFEDAIAQAQQDIIDAAVTASASQVAASESTTATGYSDLTTSGPSLSGLAAGQYVIFFGANISVPGQSVGFVEGKMSLSVNGAAAADGDSILYRSTQTGGQPTAVSVSRALLKTLTASSTLDAKYLSSTGWNGDAATFSNRWLVAVRISA